ncbi:AraC family transcriptional regulator [Marinobacterium arenosum]|uniref:AraC family transcriptional regulator n=1 Tax=Marinobacterium arenosum TaxID=2862496 RepID=UPI002103F99E|nr:AraC family transcriptional regulator [Marinobacterium arenosum]
MITVPTGYVRYLLDQVAAQGFDVEALLSQVGIAPDEIERDTEFSAVKFGQLYQRVMYITQDEYFGMLSGGRVPLGTFRMMCHSIIHCANLGKAIQRVGDFHEICRGARYKPALERSGRYARLSFAMLDSLTDEERAETPLSQLPPEQVRTSLSMWHHFISWLIGTRLELKAVTFTSKPPQDQELYRTLFQTNVKFGQPQNALVFAARFLDYPLVQNETTLRDFLHTAPYQLLVMVDDHRSLKAQVVAIFGKDFSRELPSAEEVAQALNMSVSTLRRRLQEEATSFQRIKDECRKEAALNYMNSPQLSINEVARLMGFDEPSAFFRSFKKWTGMTPGDYRRSPIYQQQLQKLNASRHHMGNATKH